MNIREIEEIQRINRIKAKYDCLSCEIVVVKEFREAPVSIVQGNGGDIEIAEMIKTLREVANNLEKNFPQTKLILPMLKGGMKEAYKKVESWED